MPVGFHLHHLDGLGLIELLLVHPLAGKCVIYIDYRHQTSKNGRATKLLRVSAAVIPLVMACDQVRAISMKLIFESSDSIL